tara:strand:- start:1137 stop:1454 length:318 start_codon:yes stop_codon:yes gene_type:complete
MIPFIRSLAELNILTSSIEEENKRHKIDNNMFETKTSNKKTCSKSMEKKSVELPSLPKVKRLKWIKSKIKVSKFLESLDYNNQIQPSYDITLIERQNNNNNQEVA